VLTVPEFDWIVPGLQQWIEAAVEVPDAVTGTAGLDSGKGPKLGSIRPIRAAIRRPGGQ